VNPHQRITRRVDLVRARREQQIDLFAATELQVSLEGAGVLVEIFAGGKLKRVQEIGHDDAISSLPRPADQLSMAGM
jgi:hypothetical protein